MDLLVGFLCGVAFMAAIDYYIDVWFTPTEEEEK